MDEEPKVSFWKRQIDEHVTTRQIVFDTLFGIVIPVLCLVFDPFIFKGGIFGAPILLDYGVFANITIGLGVILLGVWLFLKDRLPFAAISLFTGIFFLGGILAFLLGIILLPFSILGLVFYLLGLLGFSPFLTSYVFYRNGRRALNQIRQTDNKKTIARLITVGIVVLLGLSAGLQWQATAVVDRSIEKILHGDARDAEQGTTTLKRAFWCPVACFDPLVWAYNDNKNQTARERIEEAYLQITGDTVQDRLWMISWD
jgi:hypothetical protein